MFSPLPFQQLQAALLKQTEEKDDEQEAQEEEEAEKKRVKPKQSLSMRNNHATVKSLWHLSGEAVLRNNLLPPGLLSSVPNPPFTWLPSSLKAERTTNQLGTEEECKAAEGSVEGAEGVLPEEVKERLEKLQRRCDVCKQLFLEAEAEQEEAGGEGQARELARRHWDEEREVWWKLSCCSQGCFLQPLAGCSLATK